MDEIRFYGVGDQHGELSNFADADDFWGDGGDGSGRNMLGRILMEVRAELRAAATSR